MASLSKTYDRRDKGKRAAALKREGRPSAVTRFFDGLFGARADDGGFADYNRKV